MKTLQPSTDNVQEPKRETQQHNDTYRAPRLVALGTAVGIVNAMHSGRFSDYKDRSFS
jgi:hypothetical protein